MKTFSGKSMSMNGIMTKNRFKFNTKMSKQDTMTEHDKDRLRSELGLFRGEKTWEIFGPLGKFFLKMGLF